MYSKKYEGAGCCCSQPCRGRSGRRTDAGTSPRPRGRLGRRTSAATCRPSSRSQGQDRLAAGRIVRASRGGEPDRATQPPFMGLDTRAEPRSQRRCETAAYGPAPAARMFCMREERRLAEQPLVPLPGFGELPDPQTREEVERHRASLPPSTVSGSRFEAQGAVPAGPCGRGCLQGLLTRSPCSSPRCCIHGGSRRTPSGLGRPAEELKLDGRLSDAHGRRRSGRAPRAH
jgi:hypothetical protein